jgi:hypothetical protein
MRLPHLTNGHGLCRKVEIAMIPWSQLDDFVEGEQKIQISFASLQEQNAMLGHLPQGH